MTIKGWRTIAFNVLAAVVPLLELTEVQAIIPREYEPNRVYRRGFSSY